MLRPQARKSEGLKREMTSKLNMAHRQILHHLRSGEWKFATKLPVLASEYALEKMAASGWLERRGPRDKVEIRLTAAGLDALKAPVRQFRRPDRLFL